MEQEHLSEQSKPLPAKLLLTVSEAADILSLGRTVFYQLVMCKQIFSVKIGGSRRIPYIALQQFVEQLSTQQFHEVK